MELTNFIWHLGAVLAALWAGLAYRSLKVKFIELEQGVMASLLEDEGSGDSPLSPALERRRVSVRARALRWFSRELARKRQVQVEFSNRQNLYQMPQSEWCVATRRLSGLFVDDAFFGGVSERACQLMWTSEGGAGHWMIESWKGGKHAKSK